MRRRLTAGVNKNEEKEGDQPRWWSRKTLSSPHLTITPQSQLSAGQPLMEKTGTYQKRSSATKDIKKEPQ